MPDSSIIFRAADPDDIANIRQLLHANCRIWDEGSNRDHLGNLYLLICHDKLMGVLSGTCNFAKPAIDWIAVHPLYSEAMIRDIMRQEFEGLFWINVPQTRPPVSADLAISPQPI